MANPFRPAEQVAPKVKCLLYGAPGVGKTYAALTAPGPIAVIDTEGGTAFYAKRVGHGLSEFHVLTTKTFSEVESAIAHIRDNPSEYATVVIDPVTVLYETLQEAAQYKRQETNRRRGRGDTEDADLEMLDWQRIKRSYKRLMTDLVNLPVHVIVTAREKELVEGRGDNARHAGWRPDAEKSTAYYFDTVLRLVPIKGGRAAIVDKDRTGTYDLGAELPNPTFDSMFAEAIAAGAGDTASRVLPSDEAAAEKDAETTFADAKVEREEREELLTPLGERTATGVVKKGDGRHSNMELRQTPDGAHWPFRLETDDGKRIPQVCIEGPLGGALVLVTDGDPAKALTGQTVTVTGEVYEVSTPGRRNTFRMTVSRIATDEWILPAAIAEDLERPEAASVAMFDPDEQARIDDALAATA
jgi:hypothetical protein